LHSNNIDHIHVFEYQNIDITIVDKQKIPKMSLKSVRKAKAGKFLNLGEWAIALHGMVLVPLGYWF
jgi:hypothetical protein